jgi:hypothetical protein
MKKFLYFRDAEDTAFAFQLDDLAVIDLDTAEKMKLYFNTGNGSVTNLDAFYIVTLSVTNGSEREAAAEMLRSVSTNRSSMVIIADDHESIYSRFITAVDSITADVDESA